MINQHKKYQQIIHSIANRLALEAVWHEDTCNWIDYNISESTLHKKTLDGSVYHGTSGIALFLLKKETLSSDPVHHKTRIGTLRHIHLSISDNNDLDYYFGNLGKYITIHSNAILNKDRNSKVNIERKIKTCLERCTPTSHDLSILEGLGSCINPLLYMRNHIEGTFLDDCLNMILSVAIENINDPNVDRPYGQIGFGYGEMGYLPRFLKLAIILDNHDAVKTLTKAIAQEIRQTKAHWMNWRTGNFIPDLLDHAHPQRLGWQNGWAGMIQSRVELMKINDRYISEAREAVAFLKALSSGIISSNHWATNFSITNGLAGMGRILLEVYRHTGDHSCLQQAAYIGNTGYQRFYSNDFHWPSGVLAPSSIEPISTLGLMHGISGTGMFFIDLLEAQSNQLKE